MENTAYFDKLVGSVTRVARHSYYPGKEDTVELCLQEIGDLRDLGRITPEQLVTLREVLLGDETSCLLEGVIREHDHLEATPSRERIAILCEGVGSQAAFSAGVLQGLLDRPIDQGDITALAGTGYGAANAVLAWDGLLRGDPGRAVDQLRGFWRDYTAGSMIDIILNYSVQMARQFHAIVPLQGLTSPCTCISTLDRDQPGAMLQRQVDLATARALAQADDAPALVVGTIDNQGVFQACHGPDLNAQTLATWGTCSNQATQSVAAKVPPGDNTGLTASLVRESVRYKPSEIWLIQVQKRFNRPATPGSSVDLAQRCERLSMSMLERELEFVQKINTLVAHGLLIGGEYRHIEVHRIVMDHDLDDASQRDRSPTFIDRLMSYGRERAAQFLNRRSEALSRRLTSALPC